MVWCGPDRPGIKRWRCIRPYPPPHLPFMTDSCHLICQLYEKTLCKEKLTGTYQIMSGVEISIDSRSAYITLEPPPGLGDWVEGVRLGWPPSYLEPTWPPRHPPPPLVPPSSGPRPAADPARPGNTEVSTTRWCSTLCPDMVPKWLLQRKHHFILFLFLSH